MSTNAASPTLFTCRCCAAAVKGWNDGAVMSPGWRKIGRIDGPNAVCPECAVDPEALSSLISDGYAEAHIGDAMPVRVTQFPPDASTVTRKLCQKLDALGFNLRFTENGGPWAEDRSGGAVRIDGEKESWYCGSRGPAGPFPTFAAAVDAYHATLALLPSLADLHREEAEAMSIVRDLIGDDPVTELHDLGTILHDAGAPLPRCDRPNCPSLHLRARIHDLEAYAHDKALAHAVALAEDFDPWDDTWNAADTAAGERTMGLFANRLRLEIKGAAHQTPPCKVGTLAPASWRTWPNDASKSGPTHSLSHILALLDAAAVGNAALGHLVALLRLEVA